jgi:hypothetical protein
MMGCRAEQAVAMMVNGFGHGSLPHAMSIGAVALLTASMKVTGVDPIEATARAP